MKNRKIVGVSIAFLFIISALSSVLSVKAVAPSVFVSGANECDAVFLSCTVTLTFSGAGDAIVVGVDWINAATTTVYTVVSILGGSITFTQIGSITSTCSNSCTGQPYQASLWSGVSGAGGVTAITVTLSHTADAFAIQVYDMINLPSTTALTFQTGACQLNTMVSCASPATTSPSDTFISGLSLEVLSASFRGAGLTSVGAGYTLVQNGANNPLGGYSTTATSVTSPTNYPVNVAGGTGVNKGWVVIGAVFGTPVSTILPMDITITNFDLGNYLVVALNKFYNFNATVRDTQGFNINVVKWKWSDGANTAEVQYSNITKIATILQGNNIIFIGTATATSSKAAGTTKLNVIIPVRLSENVLDTTGVSISMYALASDGTSRGYVVVKPAYFNILNQGGSTSTIVNGLCSQTGGSPIFGAVCQNKGWIMTNTTWFQLQSYHTEFAINLNDNFGNPDVFLFQDFANSNAGAEHYTQAGDWKVDIGWFYFNNGAWMKGFHMTLQMNQGNQGVQDQWTQLRVLQYNGKNTLIANDTKNVFSSWIEQNPRSQIRVWVDLWISNLNASSMHGMRAGAYYYAIHQSGFTFFGSWSPFLQNASSVLRFAKNINNAGNTLPGQQIVYSKLYYNISRGHQPVGQANFQIITKDFNIEEFKRTKGVMEGVATPILVDARIPTLPVDGFLAPLYAAITNIGNFIWSALAAAFAAIWAQLAIRFPWFTGFWDNITANVVGFVNLFIVVMGQLGGFLTFLFSIAGFLTGPFTLISTAWNYLVTTYNGAFKGADPTVVITLLIMITFGLSIMEAAYEGDWPFLIKIAKQAWAIANAIMYWAYWFAKALIDAVLAIIP